MTLSEWVIVAGGVACFVAGFLCLGLFIGGDGGALALVVAAIDLAVGWYVLRNFDFGG